MLVHRADRSEALALTVLDVCRSFLISDISQECVLDVGCGYGQMAAAFADRCRSVTAIEPSLELET